MGYMGYRDFKEDPICQLYMFITDTLVVGTIFLVGIIGNSFTFAIFWKGKFNTTTSFLFMCLSLTDAAVLLTAFVCSSTVHFVVYTGCMQGFWKIYPYIIVYVFPLQLVAQTATVWVTVLIAANRYVTVCLPLRASQWCTTSKVKIQLTVVLLLSILFNIPTFAEVVVVYKASNNGTTYDVQVEETELSSDKAYQLVYNNVLYAVFIIVLPICILALLNIRLVKALKAHRRMQTRSQTVRSHNENSMTHVLVIIVIVLIVCQLPSLFTRVLWIVTPNTAQDCGNYQFYMLPITNMLIVLNSAVNFIIYVLFNQRFRGVLFEQVCKRRA